jgi:hypothetical protein
MHRAPQHGHNSKPTLCSTTMSSSVASATVSPSCIPLPRHIYGFPMLCRSRAIAHPSCPPLHPCRPELHHELPPVEPRPQWACTSRRLHRAASTSWQGVANPSSRSTTSMTSYCPHRAADHGYDQEQCLHLVVPCPATLCSRDAISPSSASPQHRQSIAATAVLHLHLLPCLCCVE